MDVAQLVGYSAAALTTLSFVPQAWRAWRTRSTRDISLGMWLMMTAGIVLWLAYGLMIGQMPVILANVAALLIALPVLALKLKHG